VPDEETQYWREKYAKLEEKYKEVKRRYLKSELLNLEARELLVCVSFWSNSHRDTH
jgi:hypothetical protein